MYLIYLPVDSADRVHSRSALSSNSTVITNTSLLDTSYCCLRDFFINFANIRGILCFLGVQHSRSLSQILMVFCYVVKYINISNVMFMYVSLKAAVITVHLRSTETTWHFSHLTANSSKSISHHFQIFTSEAKNWPFSTTVHQLNSSKIPLQLNHDVPVLSRLSLHCFPVFMIKYCIIVIW